MYSCISFITCSSCSNSPYITPPPHLSSLTDSDNELPVTSHSCRWIVLRKGKESTARMSEVTFKKHTYGRERKRSLTPIEEFDPRPQQYHGTAKDNLDKLLDKVRGMGLCVFIV